MLVNINPEPASAGESLCSLKFAAKVNGCETAAKGGARRNVTMAQVGAGGCVWRAGFVRYDCSFTGSSQCKQECTTHDQVWLCMAPLMVALSSDTP
jgi:hypothetical protein